MKSNFLSIQGSYKNLEIALFKNNKCLLHKKYENFNASANLIPEIDKILSNHTLSLNDIHFIALDQGPGAFTSLRATITTINGISFASSIILIGIDGLDALASETLAEQKVWWKTEVDKPDLIIPLLNAYNKEVYFAIYKLVGTLQNPHLKLLADKNYKKISTLLEEITSEHGGEKILFTGNGTKLYQEEIKEQFGTNGLITHPLRETCSAKHVGLLAFKQFEQGKNLKKKILPLYLKSQRFKPKYA